VLINSVGNGAAALIAVDIKPPGKSLSGSAWEARHSSVLHNTSRESSSHSLGGGLITWDELRTIDRDRKAG
jgi:hypothetical protein